MGKITRAKQEQEDARQKALLDAFGARTRELKIKSQAPGAPLTVELIPYAAHFLRDPEGFVPKTKSSDRSRQLNEAARHAFNRYPVPGALGHAWLAATQERGAAIDFKLWYICAARGGSLYKECTKALMTKKETHLFLNCRYDITLPQALRFSVLKAAGASDGIALRCARSKLTEKPFDEFWRSCARFFAAHPPESIAQCDDLIDYLSAKRRENPAYELVGLGHTLASLIKKVHEWHQDLRRLKAIGEATWEGSPLPDEDFERAGPKNEPWVWEMRQITTAKELAAEGNRMRHCVLSYKHSCISGELSIWSLSLRQGYQPSAPKITIELRKDGRIAQARGLANRAPRPDEENILRLWANRHNLRRGGY